MACLAITTSIGAAAEIEWQCLTEEVFCRQGQKGKGFWRTLSAYFLWQFDTVALVRNQKKWGREKASPLFRRIKKFSKKRDTEKIVSRFLPCVNEKDTPIPKPSPSPDRSPAKRVRFGKEEQGSKRMTFFYKKEQLTKNYFSWFATHKCYFAYI